MKVKQFDVYWVNLDPTVGSEIRKTRPGVVVSANFLNNLLETVIVVPITSRNKYSWPFRLETVSTNKKASLAPDHIRSISKKRLGKKIGVLRGNEQAKLLEVLQTMFKV